MSFSAIMHQILYISDTSLIAELAERSPIFIQISSNQLSRKNLDVRPYDPTTVRGATFNMRDQLYRGHFSATALSSGQCTGLRVGRPGF